MKGVQQNQCQREIGAEKLVGKSANSAVKLPPDLLHRGRQYQRKYVIFCLHLDNSTQEIMLTYLIID